MNKLTILRGALAFLSAVKAVLLTASNSHLVVASEACFVLLRRADQENFCRNRLDFKETFT